MKKSGNKKKKYNSVKTASMTRRVREIELYGKLVSQRPSVVHKSKKDYNRRDNKIKLDSVDW